MYRPFNRMISAFLLVMMLVGPMTASVCAMVPAPMEDPVGAAGAAPMDSSRALNLVRMTGTAPVIDGNFAAGSEWTEAQVVDAGSGGRTVKIYIMADGEWLYVMVDAVSDTTLSANDGAPPPVPKEYTAMIWDGDNNQRITYASGAAGSNGISAGGKNADFGFFIWGDNSVWNSPVTTQGTSIIINPGAGGNSVVATGFGATPNSGTAHRVHEYKIPYDGPLDELGCTLGYSFTKGFNLQTFDNITGTSTLIGQWPTNLASLGTSFDTAILPQKYPHILNIVSPADAQTFQTGSDIRFEIDATDNTMGTLQRLVYLNGVPYDMGGLNYLIKNNLPQGTYTVSFQVKDDEGFNDTKALGKINVVEKTVPPMIDLRSPTQATVTIDENQNTTFSIKWHDDNLDQVNESVAVQWTIDDKAAPVNTVTKVAINQTYFYSNMTYGATYTSAGSHSIKFKLTDSYFAPGPGQGSTAEASWTLVVNNVNRPPRIFNTDPEFSGKVVISETQSQSFMIEKSDPDLDPLTVKWYLDNVEQTGSANTDTFTFNPNAPNYNLAGNYVLRVVISDGTASDAVQWNISVTNVNRGPAFTTIEPSENQIELQEGESATVSFVAADPDADTLSYKWMINDMQQTTGTGTESAFDFATTFLASEGRDSSKSPYYIGVNVTDGFISIEREWKIIVVNVNRPPVAVIDRPSEGDTFMVDQDVNFKSASSKDPDGDPLTYTWDFGDKKTDNKAEVNHKYIQSGKYKVTLTVKDGLGFTVTRTVNLTIVIPILRMDSVSYEGPAKEGQVINISVDLTNLGDADAHSVRVLLYLGSISPANALPALVIDNVSANKKTSARTTWVADKPGNTILIAAIEESTEYQIDGRRDKQVVIMVEEKAKPVVANPLANPLLIGGIGAGAAVVGIVGFVAYRRKKEADAKEEAAIKAIMDAKTKKEEYKPKAVEASPYDRTDFKFGAVQGEIRPCMDCKKETPNASGICDECTSKRKAREAKAKMMSCPVCGNEVSKDMFTCPYCHFNFSKADKEEEVEKKHEAVGYVSDDACADCGVLFNDNMTVLKCPSCSATYHTRCASRLENCAECNAELSSGQTKLFKAPEPKMADLAETVELERPKAEAEADKVEPVKEKGPEGPACPKCGSEVEEGWKVCPSCDAPLEAGTEIKTAPVPEKKPVPPVVDKIMEKLEPAAGLTKCPKCGDDVESDWKVCPSCDASLVVKAAPKLVEKTPMPPKPAIEPKKAEPVAPVPGKCPKCGDDVESDWKVCPSCDAPLVAPKVVVKPEPKKEEPKIEEPKVEVAKKEEPKAKEEDAGKKKIVWSKTAKDKALAKEPGPTVKTDEKVEPKKDVPAPEPKKAPEEDLKAELDVLAKELEKLEKGGKDIKKAKSLATLASSFLKGKQPDKAKIYIERSKGEIKKLQ